MRNAIKNVIMSLLVCIMLPLTGMVSLAGQWEQDNLGIWMGRLNAIVLMHRETCTRTRLHLMDIQWIPPGHGLRMASCRPGQSSGMGQAGHLAWHP